MATAAKCGSTGSISLGGEITNWELNLELDVIDATSMASGGKKEYIGCLKSASGTFDSLTACATIGASTGVEFINDVETITCDIIITDLATSTPVGDKVTFKYSWVSTGEVTID